MRNISRVVVSGATSFLGSAVVKKLIENECEVYGIVRPSSSSRYMLPKSAQFHEILCDVSDTESWVRQIKNADTFLHFAWGGPGINGRSDSVVQRKSAENTFEALSAAKKLGVSRFFISGSQAEYGKVNGKIAEGTPCNPVLEYGRNKLLVSQEAPKIAMNYNMEYVHARFFSVYGPHDHPYALIPSCIRTFLADETMELSECSNLWNFLHVDDAAEAVLKLVECDLPTKSVIVNVASTDTRILREFVEEIYHLCGERGECAFGARHVSEKPVDNWPDISRLKSIINWEPRIGFEEGITALIQEESKKGKA